ncbi:MAG: NAD(+)/NADH kinase [Agathobacter sp.]|nr:NAD(+)/NADH kinase [Agathobacter sp.]
MLKFVIVANPYKDPELKIANEIVDYIREHGGSALNLSESENGPVEFEELHYENIPADTDCIMVLGGDGTLIRAVRKTRKTNIPLIGVNLGTLGYLCELELDNVYQAIDQLMQDNCTIEKRLMIKGYRKNSDKGRTALNDIVIHRTGVMALLRLNVYVNGEFLVTYDGDGVIVSTPTGSTGYNLSAGGPIIEPGANILALTPINAHSLNSKGIILKDDDIIEIEMVARRGVEDEAAFVSCDGDRVAKLLVGDRFVIERANHTIKICKVNKQSFLETMRKKMG